MKGLVIVNPHARSGLATIEHAAWQETIANRLRPLMDVIDWSETQHPNHAVALARQAAEAGYGYILAAGGDGTISEVLNGIMSSSKRPVFGVLPWGSLNDFYRALSLAESTAKPDPQTLPLDIGRATFDGVERYAALSISIGLASWAEYQYQLASRNLGRVFGLPPGIVSALVSYRFPREISLSIDGDSPRQVPMLSLAINNSPTVAGGSRLTPDAAVDDDHFDLCLIPPMSLLRLGELLIGSYVNREVDRRMVMIRRASQITVMAEKPLPVHVDGEMIPDVGPLAQSISISVLPGELRILRPSLLQD